MPKKSEVKNDQSQTDARMRANVFKRDRSGSNNAKRPPIPEQKEYFNRQSAFSNTIEYREDTAPSSSIIAEMHYQRGMADVK